MDRRRFLRCAVLAGSAAGLPAWRSRFARGAPGGKVAWQRDAGSRLFTGVSVDGRPLEEQASPGLLDASCRLPSGPECGPLFLFGSSDTMSRHPGGANFGTADGGVKFVSDTIDLTIYRHMGNMDDGVSVSVP